MDIATLKDMAAALAKTDIEWLEIDGPGVSLRLRRGHAAAAVAATAAAATPPAAVESAAPPTARAPMAGVFLHRHPLQAAPLATVGETVAAGQVIGLVQAGLLLMPVVAQAAATVLALAVPHGATVGYGDTLLQLQPTA